MPANIISRTKSSQSGIVIVETLVAILIFSVGVLGIVGMQANMLKNTAESKYRADASYIARTAIGTMWGDTNPIANLDNYVGTTLIPNLLPNGKRTITKDAIILDSGGTAVGGTFTVIINWKAPGDSTEHTFTTVANIAI